MNTFSCSLPYSMHLNPLSNALFWAVCLQSWWQVALMETLKWLPLVPHSMISCARHVNPNPIKRNTQNDQSVELPPCLSAYNRPPGMEPGTGSQCIQAQTVCSTWELNWGLLLQSGGATGCCRRSSPGLLCATRLVYMEVLYSHWPSPGGIINLETVLAKMPHIYCQSLTP